MSELKQRITDDVKSAMRGKEKERLAVLRLITAAIKQIEVDERIELDDQQVIAVLDKLAKQHRDSIEQFEKAERTDLAEKERFELSIVQTYLPAALSEDEITQLIKDAISETGATDIFDIAIRHFKRACEKAGTLADVHRREFYEKPTQVRKRKAAAAVKRRGLYRRDIPAISQGATKGRTPHGSPSAGAYAGG